MRSTILGFIAAFCFLVPAFALEGGVGRIIGVAKVTGNTAEVDLKGENGNFFNNSPVEILTPKGKMAATLVLPDGIDMMQKRNLVRVTLKMKGAFSPAGGLVTEPGKFQDFAAVEKALSAETAAAAAPPPAAAKAPPVPVCPYTGAELSAALGLKLKGGKESAPMSFPGGRSLDCDYKGEDWNTPSLWLGQIVMDDPKQSQGYFQSLAGKMENVPGDPDGAKWQVGQGDLSNATLHYIRKGVIVQARVMVSPKDPRYETIRAKLLKLRRIP